MSKHANQKANKQKAIDAVKTMMDATAEAVMTEAKKSWSLDMSMLDDTVFEAIVEAAAKKAKEMIDEETEIPEVKKPEVKKPAVKKPAVKKPEPAPWEDDDDSLIPEDFEEVNPVFKKIKEEEAKKKAEPVDDWEDWDEDEEELEPKPSLKSDKYVTDGKLDATKMLDDMDIEEIEDDEEPVKPAKKSKKSKSVEEDDDMIELC